MDNKKERYLEFEHDLRYLLCGLKKEVTVDDFLSLDSIKHAVVVFSMRERFQENNTIFLLNIKDDFFNGINNLKENHFELIGKLDNIRLFMEDFLF